VATLALLVSSLATVAVPKLAGSLIDVCIQFGQEGGRAAAKRHLDTMLFQILGILAVGGVATGVRSWRAARSPCGCEAACARAACAQRAARCSHREECRAVPRVGLLRECRERAACQSLLPQPGLQRRRALRSDVTRPAEP